MDKELQTDLILLIPLILQLGGLVFIWASENIAVNTPDVFEGRMEAFRALLYDPDDRVRMEAPEIFRVLGKRRPDLVSPYLEELRRISESDANRVVRIHCLGAVKAAETGGAGFSRD